MSVAHTQADYALAGSLRTPTTNRRTYQKENYVVNQWGEVWDIEFNELLYKSNFDDCVDFVNNVTDK